MTTGYFILANQSVRDRAAAAIQSADPDTVVVLKPKTRTLEQNARLWAMLTDISKQVKWAVDGELLELDPEDWKHILSAGIFKNQRVAQGIEGGFVILGQRTSKMTVRQMKVLQDFIEWFGDTREPPVKWTDPKVADDA